MEDGLEVYPRPDEPRRPQVGLDEPSKPLGAAPWVPIPATPGPPERIDSAYARQGLAHRVLGFEPLAGQRRGKRTARRRAVDFAPRLCPLSDALYPKAEQIGRAMANLNMHQPAGHPSRPR